MFKQSNRGIATLIVIGIVAVLVVVVGGGILGYKYLSPQKNNNRPLITITSPNGGEQWIQGSTHNITWTTSVHGKLGIQLSLADINGSIVKALTNDVVPDNGSYSWTIDGSIAPGNYKILAIYYDAGPSGQDYSNNYFSIVASINQTSGWKTYTNNEYGFEIKYPNDWSTESQEKNKLTIFCNYDCKIDKNTNDWKCHMCQGLENTGIGAPGPGLNIEVKKISLNDYIKEYETGKEIFGNSIIKQESYTLGGVQGVKMKGGTAVGVDMTIIFTEKNNNSYIISYTPMAPIQDQIVSTFKFTK